MKKRFELLAIIFCLIYTTALGQGNANHYTVSAKKITPGADQTALYFNYLQGKNIGMVVNQTSVIGSKLTPSVDSLIKLGINIKKIYGPEHGFRGNAGNGASVDNSIDRKIGLPVISLYGKHYKPTADDLQGIDLMIFDIQDVGARFYTYISTLHYVMEACAENHIELLILDRPNPNGFYVDGPVLDTAYRSFVGMDPVPIVHGMTIGEYARMTNGEGWLKNHIQCKLKIIKVANYTHKDKFVLSVNPSPNLNTPQSILLYPGLCLFEGTTLSVGRGTLTPFTKIGHPLLKGIYEYNFTPEDMMGMSVNPPLKGQLCYGTSLMDVADSIGFTGKLNIGLLLHIYRIFPDKANFFNTYFTKLAGTAILRKQIEAEDSEKQIRASWEPALSNYKKMRLKYLLYN